MEFLQGDIIRLENELEEAREKEVLEDDISRAEQIGIGYFKSSGKVQELLNMSME